MTALDTPGEGDLGAVFVVFFADFDEGGVFDQFADVLARGVDGVLVAEAVWREGGVSVQWQLLGFLENEKEGVAGREKGNGGLTANNAEHGFPSPYATP